MTGAYRESNSCWVTFRGSPETRRTHEPPTSGRGDWLGSQIMPNAGCLTGFGASSDAVFCGIDASTRDIADICGTKGKYIHPHSYPQLI